MTDVAKISGLGGQRGGHRPGSPTGNEDGTVLNSDARLSIRQEFPLFDDGQIADLGDGSTKCGCPGTGIGLVVRQM